MEEGMATGFCLQSRYGNGGGGTKCGRWNPTAEQVKVLTELFRAGLRTPTTDQIQKISAELSFYGKIESKNVFYWFQNHKARERQKRRRVRDDSKNQPDTFASSPPSKYFCQENPSSNASERVIETLQLFPLSSYDDPPNELGSTLAKDCNKENAYEPFSYAFSIGKEFEHPPLDLRLSFL